MKKVLLLVGMILFVSPLCFSRPNPSVCLATTNDKVTWFLATVRLEFEDGNVLILRYEVKYTKDDFTGCNQMEYVAIGSVSEILSKKYRYGEIAGTRNRNSLILFEHLFRSLNGVTDSKVNYQPLKN